MEISFKNENEKKTFPDKLKLREFFASRQIVQGMLPEIFQV